MRKLQGHAAWVRVLAFSQNGTTLASSCNELVCVWHADTGALLNAFPAELNGIQTCVFNVEDDELMVGGIIDAEMLEEGKYTPGLFASLPCVSAALHAGCQQCRRVAR